MCPQKHNRRELMRVRKALSLAFVAIGIAAMLVTITTAVQAPAGQGRGGGGAAAGGGGGRGGAQLPSSPVMTTMPTFKEVTGPGAMFPGLQRLPADEDLTHYKYIAKEYFVSGIAQCQPYTTRI